MELMSSTLAAQIIETNNAASAHMRQIAELSLPRDAKIAAQAGIELLADRKIANLVIDAGLAQEPAIDPALPQLAISGVWDAEMSHIAKLARSAALVAVVSPLMPSDPDL